MKQLPKSALDLLPYQRRWMFDDAPLKIVVKGRQTGYSFTATLRAVIKCLERKTTWVLLSKGERQSGLLMDRVREHVQSCGVAAQEKETTFFEGTALKQMSVRFPNGSVIYALPANPDTARGYTGNVTLDEFAFHNDAEKIYTALYPTITRGFGIEVISTPNGQQGKFYELAKAAGLVEASAGDPTAGGPAGHAANRTAASGPLWSGHWCDIYKAAREGMNVDVETLRAGLDEEAWRQEYCCEFLSSGSQWISAELLEACVSSEAGTEFSAWVEARRQSPYARAVASSLYAGWDVARNRDASVIWLSEMEGDVSWTRGVMEMRNLPTPDQLREARRLMPYIRRMQIDKSGMGLTIYETLSREFPGKVEGVVFSQATKETLAVQAKRRMEEARVRIPDDDAIRHAFRAVKKSTNALGQSRFDAEHDARYGHADHWWAFCMAEAAGDTPTYHLAGTAALAGRPVTSGFMETRL
jgi:phage FluMu gp28-like protein